MRGCPGSSAGGGVGPSPPSPGARGQQRDSVDTLNSPGFLRFGERRLQCLGGSGEVGACWEPPTQQGSAAEACAALAPPGGAAQNCRHISCPEASALEVTGAAEAQLSPTDTWSHSPTPWRTEKLKTGSLPPLGELSCPRLSWRTPGGAPRPRVKPLVSRRRGPRELCVGLDRRPSPGP